MECERVRKGATSEVNRSAIALQKMYCVQRRLSSKYLVYVKWKCSYFLTLMLQLLRIEGLTLFQSTY